MKPNAHNRAESEMYVIIEITHDTAANKPPYARIARYSSGATRLFKTRKEAEEAAQATEKFTTGIVRVLVERI